MSFAHVDLKGLVFLMSPLALSLFLPPLPQGSLSSKGRDLIEAFHLGFSVSQFLPLGILSACGALYLFPSDVGGNISDDG